MLVTTDLGARGVDVARVNLVVATDLPRDAATYSHRVGRTGRFGSRGVAVSLVTRVGTALSLAYMRGCCHWRGRGGACILLLMAMGQPPPLTRRWPRSRLHSAIRPMPPQAELAVLVGYLTEQARAAVASAAAAAAAAAANGGGSSSSATRPAASTVDPSGIDAEGSAEAVAAAVARVLLPLPESLPEDLYGYELESDWERAALRELVARQASGRPAHPARPAAVGEEQGDGAAGVGAVEGAAGGGGEAVLPAGAELQPLPEELEAEAKQAKRAAAAARKADKEARRVGAAEPGVADVSEAERLAAWEAYYQSMYGGGTWPQSYGAGGQSEG